MPTIRRAALHDLPQPMHLVAAMLRRGHYHFGLFSSAAQSLDDAQEALAAAVADRVPFGARVLDVGCGLGGTARLLAARGHEVVGLDPCEAAIAYAEEREPGRFVTGSFETYRNGPHRFEALVLVEVLQHLAPLESTLRRARDLLHPGGTVVVADAVNHTSLPWDRVPFHPAGAVASAARLHGFECLERADLTPRVAPTARRLALQLRASRPALARRFERRPALEREIVELKRQCELLDRALHVGDLGYELVVLRNALRA